MTAAATGGHTIGPSAGTFSIAESGTFAPSETTFEPDIFAHVHMDAPNAGWQVPATSRVCANAGALALTRMAAEERIACSNGFVFIEAPWVE